MDEVLRKANEIKDILNNIFVSKLGLLEIPFVVMLEGNPAFERWSRNTIDMVIGPIIYVMSDGTIYIDYYYGGQYEKDNRNIYTILESLSDIVEYSMFNIVDIDIPYARLKDINEYSDGELKLYFKLI